MRRPLHWGLKDKMILDALICCCEHKLWQGSFKTFSSVFWRRSANSLLKLINEGRGHFAMRLWWSALRCFYTAKCFAGIVFARLQHVVKIDSQRLWFVYKKHKPDTLSGIDWMYTALFPAGGYFIILGKLQSIFTTEQKARFYRILNSFCYFTWRICLFVFLVCLSSLVWSRKVTCFDGLLRVKQHLTQYLITAAVCLEFMTVKGIVWDF